MEARPTVSSAVLGVALVSVDETNLLRLDRTILKQINEHYSQVYDLKDMHFLAKVKYFNSTLVIHNDLDSFECAQNVIQSSRD